MTLKNIREKFSSRALVIYFLNVGFDICIFLCSNLNMFKIQILFYFIYFFLSSARTGRKTKNSRRRRFLIIFFSNEAVRIITYSSMTFIKNH